MCVTDNSLATRVIASEHAIVYLMGSGSATCSCPCRREGGEIVELERETLANLAPFIQLASSVDQTSHRVNTVYYEFLGELQLCYLEDTVVRFPVFVFRIVVILVSRAKL